MRRRATLERYVQQRIVQALKKVPFLLVRKKQGTVMGMGGDPDLYGVYRGRAFGFEVKRPNDPTSVTTKLQDVRLQEWGGAGAIVGVVRCPEDALKLLGIPSEDAQCVAWICANCRKFRFESAQAPAACKMCGGTRFEQEVIA